MHDITRPSIIIQTDGSLIPLNVTGYHHVNTLRVVKSCKAQDVTSTSFCDKRAKRISTHRQNKCWQYVETFRFFLLSFKMYVRHKNHHKDGWKLSWCPKNARFCCYEDCLSRLLVKKNTWFSAGKCPNVVKNTCSCYRKAIQHLVGKKPGFQPESLGESDLSSSPIPLPDEGSQPAHIHAARM